MQQILVEAVKKLPLDDQKSGQKDGGWENRSVRWSVLRVQREVEDNETMKWCEVFKSFEECRTLREAQTTMSNGRRWVHVDENQIKEAFINGGRGHPPSHLKFFLLVFSKLKEDIK